MLKVIFINIEINFNTLVICYSIRTAVNDYSD